MGRSIHPTREVLASIALLAGIFGSAVSATVAQGVSTNSPVVGNAASPFDPVQMPESTGVSPNDPSFVGGINGAEWGETVDQATQAWSETTGSSAVTIAVIDSGVDPTQPDLTSVLVPGWNVLTNSSNTADSYGHGTEVAGVAVAGTNNGQGVAAYCWTCRLMPIEVYNSGTGALASNVAAGITWAVNHGANVINISIGGAESAVEDSAVAYALAHNVVVVAAAGNSGTSAPIYPAADPGVISVAASDQTDTLFSYSDYGSWVDVAAPGSQATTLPTGGYGSVGGTSVAAPAVAGIAALMLSVDPSATPTQIADALFSTTNPVNGTNQVTYGRVNAYAAIQALGDSSSSSAPANINAPAISGTAQVGQTLSASTGSWSSSPTSFGYQWQRCSSSNCASVIGATSSSYVIGSADVGSTIQVTVTASNSAGSSSTTSDSSATVTVAPLTAPANTTAPAISGTAQVGQTLSASTGSWSGAPTSFGYQWQRCSSSNCASVFGATSSSYVLGSADVGSTIQVTVTASNSAGSSNANSAPTATVASSTIPGTGKGGRGGGKK